MFQNMIVFLFLHNCVLTFWNWFCLYVLI